LFKVVDSIRERNILILNRREKMTKERVVKGFTLIELMVVMALMAVLAVLVLGAVQLARNTANETINRSNAKAVQTALESDFARNKNYCGGTGRLACGTEYSLNAAYLLLAGKNLENSGNCSSGDIMGGGMVVAGVGGTPPNTTGYYVGVGDSACTKLIGDADSVSVGVANTNYTKPVYP
jgi:prepilin-type N-terminal cleavage/methylation domain-containing protein